MRISTEKIARVAHTDQTLVAGHEEDTRELDVDGEIFGNFRGPHVTRAIGLHVTLTKKKLDGRNGGVRLKFQVKRQRNVFSNVTDVT